MRGSLSSTTEKNSLKAYLIWCLSTQANAAGLKARIEQFKASEIEFLKTFIVSIALADGKVDSAEIKQIEKLYTVLGLDKSLVTNDIHNLTSTKKPIPISLNDNDAKTDVFELDDDILALHESDTSDAKIILESIFAVDDDIEIATVEQTEPDELDQTHRDLFELLLKKEKWQRDEVYDICKKLNLMLDGAIETINNWAYEKVDAPVLDDDGDIYIDLEIVEELKG